MQWFDYPDHFLENRVSATNILKLDSICSLSSLPLAMKGPAIQSAAENVLVKPSGHGSVGVGASADLDGKTVSPQGQA